MDVRVECDGLLDGFLHSVRFLSIFWKLEVTPFSRLPFSLKALFDFSLFKVCVVDPTTKSSCYRDCTDGSK